MVKLIQMLAVSLMLVCVSGAARAGDYENGRAAARRGDYAMALKLLSPLAQKGLAGAQNDLGYMYAEGHGVAQDYKEAVKWVRLAADQGLAQAQVNLCGMYARGMVSHRTTKNQRSGVGLQRNREVQKRRLLLLPCTG